MTPSEVPEAFQASPCMYIRQITSPEPRRAKAHPHTNASFPTVTIIAELSSEHLIMNSPVTQQSRRKEPTQSSSLSREPPSRIKSNYLLISQKWETWRASVWNWLLLLSLAPSLEPSLGSASVQSLVSSLALSSPSR